VVAVPDTRFASLGGDRIGYQVLGDGPLDLVYIMGTSEIVDAVWDYAPFADCLRRLASFSRLILFDRRGQGASDAAPVEGIALWEKWTDDAKAVLDAAGSERAAILGHGDGGPTAIMFAATQPARTQALVLFNTAARFNATEDYPWGYDAAAVEATTAFLERAWGTDAMAQFIDPDFASDPTYMRFLARTQRSSWRPRAAAAYFRWVWDTDVRQVLPSVRVPTLVLHRKDVAAIRVEHGRYLAEHISGARFVPLDGVNLSLFAGATTDLDHVERFLTGLVGSGDADRPLATILFTDIVDSTGHAATLGDRRWHNLLDSHDSVARTLIEQHRGRVVKLTGDGVLASFDGPGRAIRCACAIRDALAPLGIEIRAGLHTGEIETRGDDIAGIAVHIAERVCAAATPGEVLVSETVPRLVTGSGIDFTDRGEHELKGVPQSWHLFAVRA
jgi:class 3 adenylate cyclase/pimeloyl-ACP methyl ester carboxylesterase